MRPMKPPAWTSATHVRRPRPRIGARRASAATSPASTGKPNASGRYDAHCAASPANAGASPGTCGRRARRRRRGDGAPSSPPEVERQLPEQRVSRHPPRAGQRDRAQPRHGAAANRQACHAARTSTTAAGPDCSLQQTAAAANGGAEAQALEQTARRLDERRGRNREQRVRPRSRCGRRSRAAPSPGRAAALTSRASPDRPRAPRHAATHAVPSALAPRWSGARPAAPRSRNSGWRKPNGHAPSSGVPARA